MYLAPFWLDVLFHSVYEKYGGWWRWALISPDWVAPSRMVGVSGSVNLPLHHKVQKFSSGTGSPGWSRKKGRKTVVVVYINNKDTCKNENAGGQHSCLQLSNAMNKLGTCCHWWLYNTTLVLVEKRKTVMSRVLARSEGPKSGARLVLWINNMYICFSLWKLVIGYVERVLQFSWVERYY